MRFIFRKLIGDGTRSFDSKYSFKKLLRGVAAMSKGAFSFIKLETAPHSSEGSFEFDLTTLGLEPGTYTITVTSFANGYGESEHSNEVTYVVK